MFEFTFEVAGEEQVARRFTRYGENIRDMRPAFNKIKDRFFEGEQQQFQTEGGWGSGGWRPLSTEEPPRGGYAGWKARRYPGRPIMVVSGKLKRSLTQPGAEGSIALVFPTSLTLGTRIPYAIYHQSTRPRTSNLPRRPLIELPSAERVEWHSIIHAHIWAHRA